MSKLFNTIRDFFHPLQTKDHSPQLDRTYGPNNPVGVLANTLNSMTGSTVTEDQHRKNIERIEMARLKQDRESINNNLEVQHRIMIITLVATFIALLSSVSAIFIAISQDQPKPPIVNVSPSQPDIKVYLPEPKLQEVKPSESPTQ